MSVTAACGPVIYRGGLFPAEFRGDAFVPEPSANLIKRIKITAKDGALTGANGMTLYTFDKDPEGSGKSACNGPCATNWPPLLVTTAESAAPGYSVVMRDDGGKQWAYKGKPLYFWVKDQKPGDRTGDGFNGVWRVAKP